MRFELRIWRQRDAADPGRFDQHTITDVEPGISFLEMLDQLNEQLTLRGEAAIAFDSDCREGICGACSLVIDGRPHGLLERTTTCQLYMHHFEDRAEIVVEPWRARAFPVLRDLVVDRCALDRILQAGGYISVDAGIKPDPNSIPVHPGIAEQALDAAACIGCGACVAACPNASAMLYTAAKVSHLGLLPQGQPERAGRVVAMLERMQEEGFGGCRNYGECQQACPKGIGIGFIARMNRDYLRAVLTEPMDPRGPMRPR